MSSYSLQVDANTDGANTGRATRVVRAAGLYAERRKPTAVFTAMGIGVRRSTPMARVSPIFIISVRPHSPVAAPMTDGYNPSAGLVLSGNRLYGVTTTGGNFGGGTVFAIQTDGTGFTNVYNFSMVSGGTDTNSDGSNRGLKSNLVLSNNILYGTTYAGGGSGNGTVFALNTDGTGFTKLHGFSTPLVPR